MTPLFHSFDAGDVVLGATFGFAAAVAFFKLIDWWFSRSPKLTDEPVEHGSPDELPKRLTAEEAARLAQV